MRNILLVALLVALIVGLVGHNEVLNPESQTVYRSVFGQVDQYSLR